MRLHLQGLGQVGSAGNRDLGVKKKFGGREDQDLSGRDLGGDRNLGGEEKNLDGGSHFIKSGDFFDYIQNALGDHSLEIGGEKLQTEPAGGPPNHKSGKARNLAPKSSKMVLGPIDELEAEQLKESEVRMSNALAPIQTDPRPDHHRSSMRSPQEAHLSKQNSQGQEENPMLARSEPMNLRKNRKASNENVFGNNLGKYILFWNLIYPET